MRSDRHRVSPKPYGRFERWFFPAPATLLLCLIIKSDTVLSQQNAEIRVKSTASFASHDGLMHCCLVDVTAPGCGQSIELALLVGLSRCMNYSTGLGFLERKFQISLRSSQTGRACWLTV
jgi:hypothetical protein